MLFNIKEESRTLVQAAQKATFDARRLLRITKELHASVIMCSAMDLTVYSAAWCPECREAKRFLAKHNIPYKEVDIETTPGAVQEIVKHTGKEAIPQFVIDGEWVQPYVPGHGFLYNEMARRLGVEK